MLVDPMANAAGSDADDLDSDFGSEHSEDPSDIAGPAHFSFPIYASERISEGLHAQFSTYQLANLVACLKGSVSLMEHFNVRQVVAVQASFLGGLAWLSGPAPDNSNKNQRAASKLYELDPQERCAL